MNKIKIKHYIGEILLVTLVLSIVLIVYKITPFCYESIKVKNMTNEEVIEYVKDMSDDEYVDFLESITKTQAERVFKIKVAYDIELLEEKYIFDIY